MEPNAGVGVAVAHTGTTGRRSPAGRLRRLWTERGAALSGLQRFPAANLALACFAALVNLDLAGVMSIGGIEILRAGLAAGSMAAAATAVILLGERWGWTALPRHVASLLLGGLAALAVFYWERLGIAPAALLTATVLMVPLAPYIRGGRAGFWAFLWELIHAAALAFIAVTVFCLGVSAIFASLQYLFGAGMDMSLIYGHVWSIGLGFVGPLFTLSLVPTRFPVDDRAPGTDIIVSGVRILSDFVAVPLLAAYSLILHAYAVKVLFAEELPKNRLGWMVLSFGLCTLLLRVVVHPLGERSRVPTRLFLRWWPVPLVVPLALLVDATWLRISDLGLTPEHYGLAMFAMFLALVILAQMPRRLRADIRVIPAFGAILLGAASFGPWGMLSASGSSQAHRLADTLEAAGFAKEGQLTSTPALQRGQAQDAQSVIELLDRIGQLDRLRRLFGGRPDDPFALAGRDANRDGNLSADISRALNVEQLPPEPDTTGVFRIEPGSLGPIDISGFDTVVPRLDWKNGPTAGHSVPGLPVIVELSRDGITLVVPDKRLVFPTGSLRQAIDRRMADQRASPEQPLPPLFLEETVEGHRIGVLFDSASGFSQGDDFRLESGRASLFLRRADWQEG